MCRVRSGLIRTPFTYHYEDDVMTLLCFSSWFCAETMFRLILAFAKRACRPFCNLPNLHTRLFRACYTDAFFHSSMRRDGTRQATFPCRLDCGSPQTPAGPPRRSAQRRSMPRFGDATSACVRYAVRPPLTCSRPCLNDCSCCARAAYNMFTARWRLMRWFFMTFQPCHRGFVALKPLLCLWTI